MGIIVPVLTLVFLLLTKVNHAASKRVILVGGSADSWKVPGSSNDTLNHWAENNRFKVGDTLLWKYDAKLDSVLQVTKQDYDSCNTTAPLKQYNDGDTKVKLENSGAYFFISGAPGGNCVKGEKITIIVLSERKPGDGGSDGDSPKVSPASAPVPAPAPAHARRNAAVGSGVGSGLFFTAIAIGFAMA
ncbi:unnamed protein product [Thlaspi arvense]|uniref:Phytocyanin domain-containing protein n=1 Tax=Thlaspi arvense TaxID=13288 RepID=A0AAU9SZW3_THLAR|nr:unnamed protein product [Thlaspi arvense]